MFASLQCLPIQMLVLLHVGEVDEKFKRLAREHLVNVRIMMRDLERLSLFARALGPDVAEAHDFGIRTLRQHRQIGVRYTAATDDTDADALGGLAGNGHSAGGDGGAGEQSGFGEFTAAQGMRC